jgi:outer membrane biosynthesis protein TonB
VWQVISSLLLLGLIGSVALLAILNAGRSLPPVRAGASPTAAPPTLEPTPVVTPRITAANAPTPTPEPVATEPPSPVAVATPPEPPTPEPTPTPQLQAARVVNTAGQGVSVRQQPGPQAPRAGVLREGTRVLLTGNDQTVAARPWREIETEDHNLKGWVLADFLQLLQSTP